MEYWVWDFGAMVYWENVPDKNIKKQETSFKKHHSNIPTFHDSMYGVKMFSLIKPL